MMANTDLNNDGKISKLEAFPYWIDRLRLFPRAFIAVYIYMFYNVVDWFMLLQEPNMAQAGLVSVITGAGAAWFGLYVNSTSENDGKIIVQTDTTTSGTRASYSGSASAEADYAPTTKSRY